MFPKFQRCQSHGPVCIRRRGNDNSLRLSEHSLEIVKGFYAMFLGLCFRAGKIVIINAYKISARVFRTFVGVITAKNSGADNSNFQALIHGVINPVSPSQSKTKASRKL